MGNSMDADLSRAAANFYNSPYWRFMTQVAPDRDKFALDISKKLLNAGSISKLPPELKTAIELGERSLTIAQKSKLDPTSDQDLRTIMQRIGVLPNASR